jgi:hypothetical protein
MEASDHANCELVYSPSNQQCDGRKQAYLASPTNGELVVCFLCPGVGLLLGLWAWCRGRQAGSWMMLISGTVIAVLYGPFLLAWLCSLAVKAING